ncbi:MAG: 6-phosphogluconolactonase [Bacteroidetes bacterium]|nr:6-phosphogluconolactonase [Bacteroidota bacterium]MDA1119718.1 6-phosphogluconolactonase [Bacteroidota bacterium]
MNISISKSSKELSQKAAALVASKLNHALNAKGYARLLVSTGMSQLETLEALVKCDLQWSNVEVFHMDEYIGLPVSHKASFIKYIQERFIDQVEVKKFHPVETGGDVSKSLSQLSAAITEKPIDVGIIGIGENTHIGFNDPPADFETKDAFIRVRLDDKCKRQQVGEGWFGSTEEVPDEAITITPYQILQCVTLICGVPFKVKAEAVYKTLTSEITNEVPASILKTHDDFHLFLNRDSSSAIIKF